ncbi:reticulon-like protein B1 [Gossypium raimondii]|uniref:Reticulon-like protein n=1 Tax=Gossypium raimondii TaxID=29730 RepID=A0A0D2P163_GOSRA|nr:reticulon-like protein B1 [Gossypium raimondii]KJB39437.1 hypothetical protein B456_007G013600 [Gossypium raimondii]
MTGHEYMSMEKVAGKIAGGFSSSSSSSSSGSDDDTPSHSKSLKPNVYRLFGREKPLHQVLGAGKPADVLLWRNKRISGSVFGCATAVWVVFELLDYHLITLICHILILTLITLFLWSHVSNFIDKPPPNIPDAVFPDKCVLEVASIVRYKMNQALGHLRHVAFGSDVKSFLAVVCGLWILSVIGSCFNFLTLVYIVFVLLHTVLVMYEKYEDKVDSFSEKAIIELKKQYVEFDKKVLSKIHKGKLKEKKKD